MVNISWTKFVAQLHRLYEQKKASLDCDVVLGEYVRMWQRWTKAGLITVECIEHIYYTLKTPHYGGVCFVYYYCFWLSSFLPA